MIRPSVKLRTAGPVASRIHREEDTPCPRCGESPTDLTHLFSRCIRSKDIWDNINHILDTRYNSMARVDFKRALNPGVDREFSTVAIDTLSAIAIQHIWLDYCAITHEKEGANAPPEVVAEAILADFRLTMRAEHKSLKEDRGWWDKRIRFNPALMAREEVRENLEKLRVRTVTLESFLRNHFTHDLGDIDKDTLVPLAWIT